MNGYKSLSNKMKKKKTMIKIMQLSLTNQINQSIILSLTFKNEIKLIFLVIINLILIYIIKTFLTFIFISIIESMVCFPNYCFIKIEWRIWMFWILIVFYFFLLKYLLLKLGFFTCLFTLAPFWFYFCSFRFFWWLQIS